jgi:SAM-dependent methyltransferase
LAFEWFWLLVDHHWRSLQEAGLRRSVKYMEPGAETPADVLGEVRSYWDADAETYDQAADHYPSRPQEVAAWAAALRRLLPEPPLKVLDVGAGTGFLSLLLASQGYQVTATDLSPGMLDRLRAKATVRGLAVQVIEADAEHPPVDDFGAVVERHLMWTLPSPAKALAAWHSVAPTGRLVLVEGTWGTRGASPAELMRQRARQFARSIQPPQRAHHDEYSQRLKSALPHADGLTPDELVTLVETSSWGKAGRARIERLRDVEWAMTDGMGLLDAIIGPQPRWAVIAGR